MKARRPIALCVLPVALLIVAGAGLNPGEAARASDLGGAPSRTVLVRGIDLSTPGRVAALYRRIRDVARSVCGYADSRYREEQAAWEDCVDQAIGRAVASIGSADLTDYYLARARRGHAIPPAGASRVAERAR